MNQFKLIAVSATACAFVLFPQEVLAHSAQTPSATINKWIGGAIAAGVIGAYLFLKKRS